MTDTNYLERNGTSISEPIKRSILDNAVFTDFAIRRYEIRTDNTFEETDFNKNWFFLSGGKLFNFLTNTRGQICSFFGLNMDINECLGGKKGVYFKVITSSNEQ